MLYDARAGSYRSFDASRPCHVVAAPGTAKASLGSSLPMATLWCLKDVPSIEPQNTSGSSGDVMMYVVRFGDSQVLKVLGDQGARGEGEWWRPEASSIGYDAKGVGLKARSELGRRRSAKPGAETKVGFAAEVSEVWIRRSGSAQVTPVTADSGRILDTVLSTFQGMSTPEKADVAQEFASLLSERY